MDFRLSGRVDFQVLMRQEDILFPYYCEWTLVSCVGCCIYLIEQLGLAFCKEVHCHGGEESIAGMLFRSVPNCIRMDRK